MLLDRALCLSCNYPLKGLSAPRCPECGQAFDPADLDTVNLGAPLGNVARWILGPLSWPTIVLFAAMTALFIVLACDPEFYYLLNIFAIPIYFGATIALLGLRALLRMSVASAYRQPQPAVMSRGIRWISGILVLIVVAVIFRLPLIACFWISKAPLDELAREYARDAQTMENSLPRRAGVYEFGTVYAIEGGAMLYMSGGSGGFAYVPGGTVRGQYNSGNNGYLGGGWWRFAED